MTSFLSTYQFWKKSILLTSLVYISLILNANESITSPNGNIKVEVKGSPSLSYSVSYKNVEIVNHSQVSLQLKRELIGESKKYKIEKNENLTQQIVPVLPVKYSNTNYTYNELILSYKNNSGAIFRVYNDGIAYRFFTNFNDSITVLAETAQFSFPDDFNLYRPKYQPLHSSQEETYVYEPVSNLIPDSLCFSPLLIEGNNRVLMLISEADLTDYPGMWLTRSAEHENRLEGFFAAYPSKEERISDRTVLVTEREDFLAKTNGKRAFPWRVIGIFDEDKKILESDLIYRLGPDLAIENTEWIKPGKVAWDWWNANNIYNVDFQAGINTQTYLHYIDFAAENNLQYIILDEGWSDTRDLYNINPEIDIQEIVEYANRNNIGVILWAVWCTLEEQMPEIISTFGEWGIAGIKVDFMDRDDQKMVRFYHNLARLCAEHKLLLNMHAAYKPTGISKAYPNFLTREGVVGLEFCKWSGDSDPEYAVSIPFIRMFAGTMDYTPGAMNNAQKENFASIFNRPMSLGTRAHQMAMYIIYESPLQMLSDAPTNYRENRESLAFLSKIPVTWDETVALEAKVAEYLVMARRKADQWYIGALTDWNERSINIDLSFLPPGEYKINIIKDGPNAHRIGIDHVAEEYSVDHTSNLKINLAPGGGWAAILTRL